MGTPDDSAKTRKRIINAAGRLFAERGYNGVTVREIIAAAKTHQGALNYHFNGKELLYHAVIDEACRHTTISADEERELLTLAPEDALRIIISEAIKESRKTGAGHWHTGILARESWDPSPAFLRAADAYFKPESNFIARLISSITGRPATHPQILFSVVTLIIMIDTFSSYREFIDTITPDLTKFIKKEKALTNQIYDIVIAAAESSSLKGK